MKILLPVLFSLLLSASTVHIFPQKVVFSKNDIEDPSIFEKGQVPAHSFHLSSDSREEAVRMDPAGCEYYLSLNGTWKFKWTSLPELAPGNFHIRRFNDRKWDELEVPSNWQMEGYGHPKFRNVALSFTNTPPEVPSDYNPTGCYRREFKIPRSWKGREIILRFEGVKSASCVWLNGHPVGYNQGGFEPAEYNITPYLEGGKNTLAVKVIRFCDGSYLENQDMWRLSGIFRDVFLYARPQIHISDHFHFTDLDDKYKDATFHSTVEITNSSGTPIKGYSLSVVILNEAGQPIRSGSMLRKEISIAAGQKSSTSLQSTIEDPAKWSAEQPNLYRVVYSLSNDDGNTVEAFSENLGFREVEIRNEALIVNGVAVKLNGVNSHMHHPERGQAVPEETLRQDLLIMKRHNINCVRTSHYPPSPVYPDLADELGMYLIDEVGDEAHRFTELSYDTSYTAMYADRSRKLVYRDRNHPSVIIWSAGNESGSGPNIDTVIMTGKKIDPSRPGWMYGGNTFYIPYEDITGPRYWTPYQLLNLAEHRILGESDRRPSFMDEYLAATGNGLGGLDEYWEVIRRYPKLSGGAIWDWVSPGITAPVRITPDRSPNDNYGTILGRPGFIEGRNGRALSLSGHDDWVEFYRDPSLDITGDRLVISFWVHPSEIQQPNTFIMKGGHQYGMRMDTPGSIEYYIQHNNLATIQQGPYYRNTSIRESVTAEVPGDWYGNWHHVAGIYNGSEISIYIDQEKVATEPAEGNIAHSPFPLCIGRDAENQDQGEYAGQLSAMIIDDVQITDSVYPVGELYRGINPENTLLTMDFETDSVWEEFYSTGLGGRTYGIIWPDRRPQPELNQVKKSAQPVEITGIRPGMGSFMVINHHHFTNLDAYEAQWSLMKEGEPVEEGTLKLACAPGDSIVIHVPFPRLKTPEELILTLSFRLKEDRIWAEAGHEVAWEQFIIQDRYTGDDPLTGGDVSLHTEGDLFVISGEDFQYRLSRQSGQFINMTFMDTNLLRRGPGFNIWRAPLANDTDPWGAYQYTESKMMPGLGRSIDNQLRTLGMKELNTEVVGSASSGGDGFVRINLHKIHHSKYLRGAFESREEYTFFPDGTVEIAFHLVPHGVVPDILPKTGWQFRLPWNFRDLSWYGRGPFETYPDRKTGAKAGIYRSDPDREYVPYLMPQDYGNHTDVRWVKLENGQGGGLRISSPDLFNFSLHKFETDNLSRAVYPHQLKPAGYLTLNIDFKVSGVGGTAIRQLEPYRVKPKEAIYHLRIEPL